MKPIRVLAACVLSASPFALAAEVRTGDSLADVHNALGAPRGKVQVDGRDVLYYERGEVELRDNTVTRVALRSAEEQAALAAREERNRDQRVARQTQLVAEGTALRDRKLADAHFTNAPLTYQISYWENFAQAYPGVSVVEPLTIARLRRGEELTAQEVRDEQAARIADLEERLARSEEGGYYYPSYGYGHYRHSYNPVNLMPVRYDFQNTTAAPYETPHGSPYVSPRVAPYATPTTIDFNSYYRAAPAGRSEWADKHTGFQHSGRKSDRGRDEVAGRDRRNGRSRY